MALSWNFPQRIEPQPRGFVQVTFTRALTTKLIASYVEGSLGSGDKIDYYFFVGTYGM